MGLTKYYPYTITIGPEIYVEANNWCKEQFGMRGNEIWYSVGNNEIGADMMFSDETYLIAFKLRWA